MRPGFLLCAAACAVTSLSMVAFAAPSAPNTPATAVFVDAGAQLRSDGGGAYAEGAQDVNCVRSWFNPIQGNYYFRTASNTFCDYLNGVPVGVTPRSVTLDFSTPVEGRGPSSCPIDDGRGHSLNACGANVVADARLIAEDLFKSAAVDTPVTVHFDLYPNFVNDTAFQLRFLQRLPVSGGLGGRTVTAGSAAIAELSVRMMKGRKSSLVPVAQYYVPLSLAVTPCPSTGC